MYPKTFVHRENHHAQVVVANAEQEAELPPDFVLHASHGPALDPAAARAQLEQERAALAAERAALAEERASFDAMQQGATNDLNLIADELEAERQRLNEDLAQFAADRAAHEADRATWEAQKNSAQPPTTGETGAASATAEGTAAGETPAPSAVPAKRKNAKE
jgi:hypothetical protein